MYITREPICKNFKSKFILIKDSIQESGIKLLKAVLNTILKEDVKLHIIYYELLNEDFVNENYNCDKVSKTDAATDPCNWNDSDGGNQNFLSLNELSKFSSNFKGILCLDSLSPILFNNLSTDVYKTMHKIMKDNKDLQIISLMHTDVHDAYENELMDKLATTVLTIIPGEDKCSSTIHYSSGKVTNQLVEFKITEKFEFSVLRDFHPQIKATPSKKPDPTANLTFNLRLKDDEKEARSQVQLPYMQMQNKEIIEADFDMYDEEDPDDDLDI